MDQKSKRDKKKLEKLNKKVKPYEGWGFAVIDFWLLPNATQKRFPVKR